jgi:hypothetical protein
MVDKKSEIVFAKPNNKNVILQNAQLIIIVDFHEWNIKNLAQMGYVVGIGMTTQ